MLDVNEGRLMGHTPSALSRRGVLAAAAAGTALAAGMPAAAASASVPPAELVTQARIGAALTRSSQGIAVALRYAPDFHDRLSDWMRFWWANAPGAWIAPFEVHAAGVSADGKTLRLKGIRYTHAEQAQAGFDAAKRGARYWATVASLYHHFPTVLTRAGHLEITDGHAGFTGAADQISFVREALAVIWDGKPAPADLASRAGWTAFTRATLRRGLTIHHNR
jgi:hypothetical protein